MRRAKLTFLRPLFVMTMLALIAAQVVGTVRQESVSWDEGDHLYSGYQSIKHFDFGFNPEHPPLLKYIAALPLLGLHLATPPDQHRNFKTEAFLDGRDFLTVNHEQEILFRARVCVMFFLLLLAFTAYRMTGEMFGWGPACLVLVLIAFDPNLLAHGGFVATDTAISCFFLLSLYGQYRFMQRPTLGRALAAGGAVGLALASKHTGALLLPIAALVLLSDWLLTNRGPEKARRYALGFATICAVSVTLLWASYGFSYAARPHGESLNPTFASYVGSLHPGFERSLLLTCGRFHLLPEAYLYGIADVQKVDEAYTAYFFGKVYPHGIPLYFPAVLLIKSTLPFLLLLLATVVLVVTGRFRRWREISILTIPPLFYILIAMASHMNIGVRHILPMYPPLYVLGAGAVWPVARSRHWTGAGAVLALLAAWQVWGTVRIFPAELAFANELWGGPSQVHRYLGDSNVDWGQQLVATSKYIREHGIRHCWIIYFPEGVVDTDVYGIPCKPLPTANTLYWLDQYHPTPEWVNGPVFISDGDLESIEFGPPALNPYEQFKTARPTAVIQYGMSVFDGRFHLPLAAALSQAQLSGMKLQNGDRQGAKEAADKAMRLAPGSAATNLALAKVLAQMGDRAGAAELYRRALGIAVTVEPAFELPWKDEAQEGLRKESAGR